MARLVFQSRKPLFWEQIRLGLLPGDAGVAVGLSATCGRRWFREAGRVKPHLSKPALRGPRPRLTLDERIEIQAGVHAEESLRSIGRRLGRPASTIKREIDNNTDLRTRKNPKRSGIGASTRSARMKVVPRPRWPTERCRLTTGQLIGRVALNCANWP